MEAVRMIRLPLVMAGVDMVKSPRELVPRISNSGPAWITNVSPSSLETKILPL